MGLFNKLKDILFVEEEEIPVITQKEEKVPEIKKVNDSLPSRSRNIKRDIEPVYPEEPVKEEKEEVKKSSPFLSFDEEEFKRANYRSNSQVKPQPKVAPTSRPRVDDTIIKTTTTNIKRVDTKDYSRYEITKTVEEKKPFRPSPVISPVYGILDKNYRKEDVVTKARTENTLIRDVDVIRKKAFGELEDMEMPEVKKEPVKEPVEDKSIDDLILKEIDTKDTVEIPDESDVIINSINAEDMVDDIEPIITHYDDVDNEDNEDNEDEGSDFQVVNERTSALEILDEIEKELNKDSGEAKKETLEGDLFNLIDSMYDNRKEEE